MKTEVLKKHHFWILSGLVPLLVLIGVLIVSSSVGGEISTREGKIKQSETAIKSKTNPKPTALLDKMDETIKTAKEKKGKLWDECFIPQKSLYGWLESPALKPIEALNLKFGEKIPNKADEYEEFKKKEVYENRFDKMAKLVSPTMFPGNSWQNTLRHVNAWSDVKLTSEQIWLLLEDIWVQESLLEAVRSVNQQMAEFTRVKFERKGQVIDDPEKASPNNPLRRKFRSRTWEIELEVVQEGNKNVLKGTLTNITDKLQLLGTGNIMTLKVWLQKGNKEMIEPFEFKIGGEFVPGAGETRVVKDANGERTVPTNVLEVLRSDDHIITVPVLEEIVRVEQVFDARTVPIRLIHSLALGKKDSRNEELPLKPPTGKNFEDAPAPAAAATGSGTGGKPGSTVPGPNPTSPMGPGSAGGQAAAGQLFGGGTVASVLDGNKKRYLVASDEVRRMPVAICVVVDQAYLQDVLLAFANSPLRFQITQAPWSRFRGVLDLPSSGTGGSSQDPGNMVVGGQANMGAEFRQQGGPGMRRPGMSGGTPMMPRPPGPGFPPPGSSPGMGFPGMGGQSSTVSDSQLTSGLIELTIYGVVSLYTSPEAAKADSGAKKDPKDPKASGTPDPKGPAAPNPKGPEPKIPGPGVPPPKK